MSDAAVRIAAVRPDHPGISRLIGLLDAYQSALYPPESNHLLPISALLRDDIHFVGACRGERWIGCGCYRICPGYAEIKRMFVDPAERGRGIGRGILAHLEATGGANGVRVWRLETGIHQPQAIALYERHGYHRRPPFGAYRADPLSIFMEKRADEPGAALESTR